MNTNRRQRTTSLISMAGLLALFVCIFTLPPALVHLGRAASESASVPLTGSAVTTIVVGFGTLLMGGVLSIIGMVRRRTSAPVHNPEDDYVAEQFGEGEMYHDYDPMDLNPHLRTQQRHGDRD
ncbi:hypothetical protein GCM10025781_23600 [Kocuria gwangalliensis]|uniref:Uncharacterized protein n=1 Tax=Kocuria gwangalliensis TaxID=501592 RepID=A0ABP8XB92_9MICC